MRCYRVMNSHIMYDSMVAQSYTSPFMIPFMWTICGKAMSDALLTPLSLLFMTSNMDCQEPSVTNSSLMPWLFVAYTMESNFVRVRSREIHFIQNSFRSVDILCYMISTLCPFLPRMSNTRVKSAGVNETVTTCFLY